jgi:hypothetical protein
MSDNKTKTANSSHLKDLLLLFAIPIAIAVFAAIIIYVPRLLAHPKYDFIYSVCSNYSCKDSYSVDGTGHVMQDNSSTVDQNYYDQPASLRYYDASSDSTRSLTLQESKQYRLDTSSRSPDGYTLSKESSDSGFLFWGNYDEGWYIKSGAKTKKVELAVSDSYYSQGVTFLGWVNK